MINVSKRVVKKKSKKPKKAAVKIDMAIITNVKIVTCTREGQLTCFISPFVSLIYSINRMSFPLKKPLRGYVFLYHTPPVSKSQPRSRFWHHTLCGWLCHNAKIHYGVKRKYQIPDTRYLILYTLYLILYTSIHGLVHFLQNRKKRNPGAYYL